MPNWCNNYIEMDGPAEKISQINEQITTTEDGLLQAIAPLPKWDYHDAIANWGTKWDISDAVLEYSEYSVNGETVGRLEGYFDSAWSPPTDAVRTFLSNNPDCDVNLFYYEPANDFAGTLEFGDVVTSDVGTEFFEDDPTGQELQEHFGIIEDLNYYKDEVETEILLEPVTLNNPEEEQ